MNLKNIKLQRERSRLLEGICTKNPIFVRGLALPFAVMITTNLKNAVALSILFACSLIPCVLLCSLLHQRLPKWGTLMVCSLLTMLLIMSAIPLVVPIAPEITDSLGIYVPILAVNSVLSFLCLRHRKNKNILFALTDSVCYSVGFALALCLISALRELGGSNTLWGISMHLPIKMSGLQVAFSGFIVTAFLCALFQAVGRCVRGYRYRQENPLPAKEGMTR